MSPSPRGGSKARRGRGAKKRRGGGAARVAFAFLVAVAAAGAGVAMYFGFVPGPWAGRVSPVDSTFADSAAIPVPTTATGADAPPATADSAASASAPAAPVATHAVTQADSAAGESVYRGAGRCVGCHGAVGEGAATLGPSLRDGTWTSGDGSVDGIARVIAGGAPAGGAFRVAMPAYASQLGPDDVRRVAVYVYTLSHPGVAVPDSGVAAPPATQAVNADARPTVPAPATPVPAAPSPAPAGTTTSPAAPMGRPTVPPPPRKP